MPYGMPDYKQGGQSFSIIRVTFVMTLLVGLYIFAFRDWIADKYFATVAKQTVCFNLGGSWNLWTKQCESNVTEEHSFIDSCEDFDGTYEGCLSPCRNQLNSSTRVCDAPCNHVCQY